MEQAPEDPVQAASKAPRRKRPCLDLKPGVSASSKSKLQKQKHKSVDQAAQPVEDTAIMIDSDEELVGAFQIDVAPSVTSGARNQEDGSRSDSQTKTDIKQSAGDGTAAATAPNVSTTSRPAAVSSQPEQEQDHLPSSAILQEQTPIPTEAPASSMPSDDDITLSPVSTYERKEMHPPAIPAGPVQLERSGPELSSANSMQPPPPPPPRHRRGRASRANDTTTSYRRSTMFDENTIFCGPFVFIKRYHPASCSV